MLVLINIWYKLFQIKERTKAVATTTVEAEGTSALNKNHYMKQASLLLAQMVRVRKKAKYLHKETYVSTLNSLIRTLTQLMRAIGESKVDKDKVEQILGMLKKRAEDIDSDLDTEMRKKIKEETTIVSTTVSATETTEEEFTTVSTILPTTETTTEGETTTVDATVTITGPTTEETTTEHAAGETTTEHAAGEISDTDRTAYTKQARSLIMGCVKLRKKASQTGEPKYVRALKSYIKALARLMKRVRELTFNKKQVEDSLKLFKTKVSEIDSVLKQNISIETTSVLDGTVEVTPPSVSEVGKFTVFLSEMQP